MDTGSWRVVDIALLNRVIRRGIIVYVIFEEKLEGVEGRGFQVGEQGEGLLN